MVKMITLDALDEEWWPQARTLYHDAFPHGRKPDSIIGVMFERGMSNLHLIVEEEEVIGMAITGLTGPLAACCSSIILRFVRIIGGRGYGYEPSRRT